MNAPGPNRWLIPALAIPLLPFVAILFRAIFPDAPIDVQLGCLIGVFGVMGILVLAAISYHWNFYQSEEADRYEKIRKAEATTPQLLIINSIKDLHPDLVKYVARFSDDIEWEVEPGTDSHEAYFTLKVVDVDYTFIEFVLDNSTEHSVMQKRNLHDGSKEHDPRGMRTDYEQYDNLLTFWRAKRWIVDAAGNLPARWANGATPDRVREKMGITGKELASMD